MDLLEETFFSIGEASMRLVRFQDRFGVFAFACRETELVLNRNPVLGAIEKGSEHAGRRVINRYDLCVA